MDILILSGIAYIGHELSKRGLNDSSNISKNSIERHSNQYPIKDDNLIKKKVKVTPPSNSPPSSDFNNSSYGSVDGWSLSTDHNLSNFSTQFSTQFGSIDSYNNTILPSKMTPYFSSTKGQNTNEKLKERNLENFTGVEDNIYQKKKEISNMFNPTQTRFQPVVSNQVRLDRYKVSGKMDGISPIEKTYVGPGLNLDPSVTAKGGFHDTFRILPEHNNSYSKHSFKGRVIPGKSLNSERNFTPSSILKNRPEKTFTLEERPLMASSSAFKGLKAKENYNVRCNNRTFDNSINNHNIQGSASLPPKPMNSNSDFLIDKNDNNCSSNYGAPSTISNGAYTVSRILTHDSDREQCGDVSNVHNPSSGVVYNNNIPLNKTLRETTEHNSTGHINPSKITNDRSTFTTNSFTPDTTLRDTTQFNKSNGFINNTSLGSVKANFVANNTHRQQTSTEYSGILKGFDESSNRNYSANNTHRESTSSDYTGSAISNSKASLDTFSTDNSQSYHKKEDSLIGFSPGPDKLNNTLDNPDSIVNAEFKTDANYTKSSNPSLPSKLPSVCELGLQNSPQKIDEVNTRFDPSLQLNDNPLVILPNNYTKSTQNNTQNC